MDVETAPATGRNRGKVFSSKVRQGTLTADIPAAAGKDYRRFEGPILRLPAAAAAAFAPVPHTAHFREVFIPDVRVGRRAEAQSLA
jgi:hypothetical protein